MGTNLQFPKRMERLNSKHVLSILLLWMREPDVDGGFAIWKGEYRLLKTSATGEWLAYHTGRIKQICMQKVNIIAGRQELLLFTVCQLSQAIMGRPCLSSWFAAKDRTTRQGTVDGSRRRDRPCNSWKDIKKRTGQSMSSLLGITDNKGEGQSSQQMHLLEYPNERRLGVTGIS